MLDESSKYKRRGDGIADLMAVKNNVHKLKDHVTSYLLLTNEINIE